MTNGRSKKRFAVAAEGWEVNYGRSKKRFAVAAGS